MLECTLWHHPTHTHTNTYPFTHTLSIVCCGKSAVWFVCA